MEKVSDQMKGLIWTGLLNAHYSSIYYGYLANRLSKIEKSLTALIVALSSGAVIALTADLNWPYVAEACGFVSALVGAYLYASNPSRVGLLSAWEAYKWSGILLDYERLWECVDRLDASEVSEWWRRLEEQGAVGTEAAPVEFPLFKKLRDEAQEEVIRVRGLSQAA